ncbi:MAG: PilZ domain-containing protein [Pseudomonadota bacterium]
MFNRQRPTMEGRRGERVRTQAEGAAHSPRGYDWYIQYQDLSPGGCRVDDPRRGFELGSVVQLEIAGSGPYHAEVAWRQGDRVGLEFVKPLSEKVYQHLKNEEWDAAKNAEEGEATRFPVRRLC